MHGGHGQQLSQPPSPSQGHLRDPAARGISETPSQHLLPTRAQDRCAAICTPLPAASLPAAGGSVWNSKRPRRRWLRQVRSDCGFDQTRAMFLGGKRPLTRAQLPSPPQFMELRWEPGLQPAFSWHRAVLTGALGTESRLGSPRWGAAASGQTPGCCQHQRVCGQVWGSC